MNDRPIANTAQVGIRPDPPAMDIPPGLAWIALPEDASWEKAPLKFPCQKATSWGGKACGKPGYIRLCRSHGKSSRWWYYCREHAYSRWLENGQVMSWNLTRLDIAIFALNDGLTVGELRRYLSAMQDSTPVRLNTDSRGNVNIRQITLLRDRVLIEGE